MIQTVFHSTRSDGVNLYRTFSDTYMIQQEQTGTIYSEAIDVEGAPYTYVETDIFLPEPEEPEDAVYTNEPEKA